MIRCLCLLVFWQLLYLQSGWALSLPESLQLARQQNPTLRSNRHQLDQAVASVQQERGSYRPTIDATASYTALVEPQGFLTSSGTMATQDRSYAAAAISVEQILYDFGRTAGRVAAAEARQTASAASISALEQEVFLATVRGYYVILQAQREVESASSEVAAVEDHLRVATSLFEAGMVTRNDLLQAEVRLAMGRQQQLEWENRLLTAWLQFNYLLGQPQSFRAELVDDSDSAALSPGFEPDEMLLEQRPDLRSAAARLQAGSAEIGTTRGNYLPQLYLRGEASYIENSHASEETIYQAKLGLRCNLYDGLATSAALRRALANEAQLREQMAELRQGAELEYCTAWSEQQVAAERSRVLLMAIGQAEENLRINRERYREQVGTATELLDAQTLLTQARSSYFSARYAQAVARARIDKALGRLGG